MEVILMFLGFSESRTEDPLEKMTINKILQMKESSLSKSKLICDFLSFNKVYFFSKGDLDDKMKWLKNFERLLEIQRNVVWPGVMEMEPKQYFPEFLKTALMKQPCERLIVSPRRYITFKFTTVFSWYLSNHIHFSRLFSFYFNSRQ